MANQTLRELAQAHARGDLDKETYRKSRAALIQGIISATIPLKQIEYPPLVQPPAPEALDDTQRKDDQRKTPVKNKPAAAAASPEIKTAASPDNVASPDSEGSHKVLIAGLAVAVVAIIIVALIALLGGGAPKQINTSTTAGAEQSVNSIAAPQTRTQAQDLMQDFLDKNNWSSSSLDDFLQQWAEIATGDMLASRDSLEMGQLTNAIYKQLLEEQALSGLVDDDSSLNKQRQLVQFAIELGIDDPRISLPEEAELMDSGDSLLNSTKLD